MKIKPTDINGTITIAGGGTGSTSASAARTNLGLDAGGAGDIWVEKAGDTMTGSLVFSGVGLRIQGDFSNATATNRLSYQTSTVNGNSTIQYLPNGTGNISAVALYNAADPDNASRLNLVCTATEVSVRGNASGTGVQLPLTFYTNGSEKLRLTTGGILQPGSDDGTALGVAGTAFSDLFLASGGVVNWASGNATLTHSTGLLTSNVDVVVPDEAYGSGWNGSLEVPTKNAVYDKIQLTKRAAAIGLASAVTGANMTSPYEVAFDATVFDDASFVSYPYLVVPAGVTRARLSATIRLSNLDTTAGAYMQVAIQNKTASLTIAGFRVPTLTAANVFTTTSPVVPVTPGDQIRVLFTGSAGQTSVNIDAITATAGGFCIEDCTP